jgi:hypothetical protein
MKPVCGTAVTSKVVPDERIFRTLGTFVITFMDGCVRGSNALKAGRPQFVRCAAALPRDGVARDPMQPGQLGATAGAVGVRGADNPRPCSL